MVSINDYYVKIKNEEIYGFIYIAIIALSFFLLLLLNSEEESVSILTSIEKIEDCKNSCKVSYPYFENATYPSRNLKIGERNFFMSATNLHNCDGNLGDATFSEFVITNYTEKMLVDSFFRYGSIGFNFMKMEKMNESYYYSCKRDYLPEASGVCETISDYSSRALEARDEYSRKIVEIATESKTPFLCFKDISIYSSRNIFSAATSSFTIASFYKFLVKIIFKMLSSELASNLKIRVSV